MAGPLNGHYLHRSSIAETHYPHLVPRSHYRLAISWGNSFWGERQQGPPPLAVHQHLPLGVQPAERAAEGTHLAYHPLHAGE
jgi:hypothetical protein